MFPRHRPVQSVVSSVSVFPRPRRAERCQRAETGATASWLEVDRGGEEAPRNGPTVAAGPELPLGVARGLEPEASEPAGQTRGCDPLSELMNDVLTQLWGPDVEATIV